MLWWRDRALGINLYNRIEHSQIKGFGDNGEDNNGRLIIPNNDR